MTLLKSLRGLFLLILFSPYLFFLLFGYRISFPEVSEFKTIFLNSSMQAGLSALLSLVVGFLLMQGLLKVRGERSRSFMSALFVLPNMIPPLVLALSLMNLLESLSLKSYGLGAVILCHTLMNGGLVAVMLLKLTESRMGHYCEIAETLGARRLDFFIKVYLPLMKVEFLSLFLFLFALCFSSFTIPQLLSDIKPLSLEVLVYQKLLVEGNVSEALGVVLLQMSFMVFLTYILSRVKSFPTQPLKGFRFTLLASTGSLIFGVFIFLLSISGVVLGGLQAASEFELIPWSFMFGAFMGTAVVGLLSGIITYGFLTLIIYIYGSRKIEKTLLSYMSPSGVFIGLVFVLLATGIHPWVLISLGVALLAVTVVYRMGLHSSLKGLEDDISKARVLGACRWQIFRYILLPQLRPKMFYLSGLVSFWAVGEYAISIVVAKSDVTLSLWVRSMIKAYRFDQASLVSIVILVIGFLFFLIYEGLSYVAHQKLK